MIQFTYPFLNPMFDLLFSASSLKKSFFKKKKKKKKKFLKKKKKKKKKIEDSPEVMIMSSAVFYQFTRLVSNLSWPLHPTIYWVWYKSNYYTSS